MQYSYVSQIWHLTLGLGLGLVCVQIQGLKLDWSMLNNVFF